MSRPLAMRVTVPPSRYVVHIVIDPDAAEVAITTDGIQAGVLCPPGLPEIVIEPWPPA